MNTHALNRTALALSLCASALSPAATAYDQGDWVARAGVHYVMPKDDNHETVSVDSAPGITGSIAYFVAPAFAVDLLLALPFEHDITLNDGGSEVGSTQHLPPTLSLVWYPQVSDRFHPFVGAGINYTIFFEEETKGALAGTKLELDDSFGPAAVIGAEWTLSPKWTIMVDTRYLQIESEAKLNGASLGDVEIDPFAVGAAVGYRF